MQPFLLCLMFWTALGIFPGQAVETKGLLITEPFPEAPLKITPFSSIQWQSAAIGSIDTPTGAALPFQSDLVVALVYYDDDYWREINSAFLRFRQEITPREVLLPVHHPNLLTESDLASLQDEIRAIDALSIKYPAATDLLSSARIQIDQDITKYQSGQRKLSGIWQTEKALFDAHPDLSGVSLTTKSGRHFENITLGHATVDGVSILFPSGAATIPLSDLPDAPEGWPSLYQGQLLRLRQQSEALAQAAANQKQHAIPIAMQNAPSFDGAFSPKQQSIFSPIEANRPSSVDPYVLRQLAREFWPEKGFEYGVAEDQARIMGLISGSKDNPAFQAIVNDARRQGEALRWIMNADDWKRFNDEGKEKMARLLERN